MRFRNYSAVVAAIVAAGLVAGIALPAQASVKIVGGGTYGTLAAAVAAAKPGNELLVSSGWYVNDFVTITIPLTITGVGDRPIFQATRQIPNGKGIIVADASLTIRNLGFIGAQVADRNGAAIRYEFGDLTIENSAFRGNQDGILANSIPGGDLVVRNSRFIDNGTGDGRTHALYANRLDSLTVENSSFEGTKVGHDIKSRALRNIITGNTLDDGVSGTTSYAIDLSNGGVAEIRNNIIKQGPKTQNPSMIAYGPEGNLPASNSLLVQNNTFINTRPGSSVGVNNFSGVSAQLLGNTFQGVATPLAGPGTISSAAPATLARATVFDLAAVRDDPAQAVIALADPTEAPEPATLAVFGAGLLVFAALRHRAAAAQRRPASTTTAPHSCRATATASGAA